MKSKSQTIIRKAFESILPKNEHSTSNELTIYSAISLTSNNIVFQEKKSYIPQSFFVPH